GDPESDVTAWDTDWYNDDPYFVRDQIDADLNFGANFFPLDDVVAEDPAGSNHNYHFGVHWSGLVHVDADGDYGWQLRTDDDAWLYIDDNLIGSNPGIHAPSTISGDATLTAGWHIVEIYFAERHTVQSHMSFSHEFGTVYPYNTDCDEPQPEEPDEAPEVTVVKTGSYDAQTGIITFQIDWEITGTDPVFVDDLTITDTLPGGVTYIESSDPGSESGGVVTWALGSHAVGESGFVTVKVALNSAFAGSVISNDQGKKKNGSNVAGVRSNPDATLGMPETDGLAGDAVYQESWFYSLGFATEEHAADIVLKFDNKFYNGPGNDLMIYEVTGSSPYPDEKVKVEVSKDAVNWYEVGIVTRDGVINLDDASGGAMDYAQYVRLTDVSNPDLFTSDAD